MSKTSPNFQQWVLQALDLGFGCISDGDHAPFVMILNKTGKGQLIDLKGADGVIDSRLVDSGREVIKNLKPAQLYALVWDGYLTTDDQKQEAVFVEAGANGEEAAFVFAQKYKQKKRSKTLVKEGKPLLLDKAENLWR